MVITGTRALMPDQPLAMYVKNCYLVLRPKVYHAKVCGFDRGLAYISLCIHWELISTIGIELFCCYKPGFSHTLNTSIYLAQYTFNHLCEINIMYMYVVGTRPSLPYLKVRFERSILLVFKKSNSICCELWSTRMLHSERFYLQLIVNSIFNIYLVMC